jgi:hypothetical protein
LPFAPMKRSWWRLWLGETYETSANEALKATSLSGYDIML